MKREKSNVRYNIESLRKINSSYNSQYGISQSDVDKANMYVDLIESTREDLPVVGDIVQYTTKHGCYYASAHIEKVFDNEINICEQPYVPFISPLKNGILCFTSGGAWMDIPLELKFVGKRKKAFCDWGHCGACANGAIHFYAEVNVWEYKEPNPLYGEYSTKDWRRIYVSKLNGEEAISKVGHGYEYLGEHIAWRNKDEFDEFIREFNGVVFSGNWPNQMVVWCYKEEIVLTDLEKLIEMDLPETTILLNGRRPAKVKVDDVNKTVIKYANW